MHDMQWRAEAVGCPGPTRLLDTLENIFYSSRKISDALFLSVVKFQDNSLPGCPSRAASCPGNDIFLFIFCHLPTFFFTKTGPLDAPQGGCPGPSHRPHSLCTPLREIKILEGEKGVASGGDLAPSLGDGNFFSRTKISE